MPEEMKRSIITISGTSNVSMPENITDIWMSETELVSLFEVIAPTVRAAIKAVHKSGILKEHEAQRYIRLSDKCSMDVYSLEMVVALAFRINSYGAERVRKAILERLYLRKQKTSIFFSLGGRMEALKYQA